MPNLVEHPGYGRLISSLRSSLPAIRETWEAPVYRCVELRWARPSYLISGEGTRVYGSRWIRPGFQNVVHASSTESIALKESRRNFTRFQVEKPRMTPRVVVQISGSFSKFVNLFKAAQSLDWLTLDELLREDWMEVNQRGYETLSQSFGRAAFELGMEGLIVPSTVDRRGRNLVWFPANLSPASRPEISGQSELERWLEK